MIASLLLSLLLLLPADDARLYADLQAYCESLESEFGQIPEERQAELRELATVVAEDWQTNGHTNLLFVCTHNSRRSQLGQAWALTAARYYGVSAVQTYSGGTEATAFNPRAIAALERAGFKIRLQIANQDNPGYLVRMGRRYNPELHFSKTFSTSPNPQSDFIAVMVCSEADRACPVVDGASARVAIPYVDPKAFDDTPREQLAYDERCRQIARELFFMMSQVKAMISQQP